LVNSSRRYLRRVRQRRTNFAELIVGSGPRSHRAAWSSTCVRSAQLFHIRLAKRAWPVDGGLMSLVARRGQFEAGTHFRFLDCTACGPILGRLQPSGRAFVPRRRRPSARTLTVPDRRDRVVVAKAITRRIAAARRKGTTTHARGTHEFGARSACDRVVGEEALCPLPISAKHDLILRRQGQGLEQCRFGGSASAALGRRIVQANRRGVSAPGAASRLFAVRLRWRARANSAHV
jgi:hypothetical protein